MEYVASLSYGKDSIAMLHVIKDVLHLPLDRIVTAEVWATDEIQADLPPMVEFKTKADAIIRERWGITVEHYHATYKDGRKMTYDSVFHTRRKYGKHVGEIVGHATKRVNWCNSLKTIALRNAQKSSKGCTEYIGIAADETIRIARWQGRKAMPLVDAGWTEQMCRDWCVENDFLAPIYTAKISRGGVLVLPFSADRRNEALSKTVSGVVEIVATMGR